MLSLSPLAIQLDHWVDLFVYFCFKNSHPDFIVATQVYIPNSSIYWYLFLCIPSSICCCLFLSSDARYD